MKNWDPERWREIPQETCGRTTNQSRLGTAKDKGWSEFTAHRFFWLTRSYKKNKENIAIPGLYQGGFFQCVPMPSTGNSVCHLVARAEERQIERWMGAAEGSRISGRGEIWKRWGDLFIPEKKERDTAVVLQITLGAEPVSG